MERALVGIITFNPELAPLREILEVLENDQQPVVLVDNASANAADIAKIAANYTCARYVLMPANVGVAVAVNRLYELAKEGQYDYLLPLDQDSIPQQGLVSVLIACTQSIRTKGERVAAVGPAIYELHRQQFIPFIRFRFPVNKKIEYDKSSCNEEVESDFIITSGSLISVEAVTELGGMDEMLFIDNVDLDWCFRARAAGWKIYGTYKTKLSHRLGEEVVRLPVPGFVVRRHRPERYFYIFRNRLLLYRRTYANKMWIFHDVFRLVGKIIAVIAFDPARWESWRHMKRGIAEAFRRPA